VQSGWSGGVFSEPGCAGSLRIQCAGINLAPSLTNVTLHEQGQSGTLAFDPPPSRNTGVKPLITVSQA